MSFSTFRVLLGACAHSLSFLCMSCFFLVYILSVVLARCFPFAKALLSGREVTVSLFRNCNCNCHARAMRPREIL